MGKLPKIGIILVLFMALAVVRLFLKKACSTIHYFPILKGDILKKIGCHYLNTGNF